MLVSYLDRNKVIRIPTTSDSDELVYLKKEFKKMFSFGENVNLEVTFQKFDSEWDEYVDLESQAVLCHKDKLKAVITPLLEDNTPASTRVSSPYGETKVVKLTLYLCVCTFFTFFSSYRILVLFPLKMLPLFLPKLCL